MKVYSVDERCEVVIIGGGFYGLYLAEFLATRSRRVVLCEQGAGLMRRASYANQARVHNGYHYPRSVLTALRSRVNFPRFVEEFSPAVDATITKVYGVGRRFSKVTADQFYGSMKRIGAPIQPAPKHIFNLFDPSYIEAAFLTREYVFNAMTLCALMTDRVRRAGVEIRLLTEVRAVRPAEQNAVRVEVESPGGPKTIVANHVFCCTYSHLNAPGSGGQLEEVSLKHEIAEMALVEVPEPLKNLGVTIMDGPFFSLMPFPALRLHTLSHVRYTPHAHWFDGKGKYEKPYDVLARFDRQTAFPHMVRDAARYLPSVAGCNYRDSLWEVKTVLPRSETDDSRPILFKPHFGLPNYHLVMGGKIDNVYDICDDVARTYGWSRD